MPPLQWRHLLDGKMVNPQNPRGAQELAVPSTSQGTGVTPSLKRGNWPMYT